MENNKDIQRLLKGAKNILVVTENGCGIEGRGAELLALYTMLTQQLNENIDKPTLEHAFKRAFLSSKELLDDLKDLLDKLKNEVDKFEND